MISVALPIWNSKKIAWLCMESLCRQRTTVKWEVIVFEEKHGEALGKVFYESYRDRLKKAGCIKLLYLTRDDRITLSEKWQIIAQACNKKSDMMCLCAADNYYHPLMIQDSHNAHTKGHDWFYTVKGYFLNFENGRIVIYNRPIADTGLQMAIKTSLARRIPPGIKKYRTIDCWVRRQCDPVKPLIDNSDHWQWTLCTHGYNNISRKRGKSINEAKITFYPTSRKLKNIVPGDVIPKIEEMYL